MFYDNTLNLKQELGGSKIKQGDFGSVLSFILLDGNNSYIDELNKKTASISLCTDDKILYVTTATINNSTVEFKIDKAIPVGVYYVEIKVDNYIFPSDRSTIISIEQGATVYDLKDLIPNYDVSMTLTDILNKLDVKDGQVVDLQNKMNAIYSNALSDHAEILNAKETFATLDGRLDAIEIKDTDLQSQINTNKNSISNTNTRIDNLVATAGNGNSSELSDIRVGFDGLTYQTAGSAVRENDANNRYDIDIIASNLNYTRPNLVYFSGTNITRNGITWTYYKDGSISANGTASSIEYQKISIQLPAGEYYITGSPAGSTTSNYHIMYTDGVGAVLYQKDGSIGTLSLPEERTIDIYVRVLSGITVNNVLFKPMLYKKEYGILPYIQKGKLYSVAPAVFSNWKGMTANFIGDSITYGAYGNYVEGVKSRLGLATARNYGVGGCLIASSDQDAQYTPVVKRWDSMEDADIIFVFAGTNDFAHQIPLGDPSSTDITTFNGALNTIMDGLRTKYPDKLVIFSSILHRFNDTALTIKADEYRNAIKERCESKKFVFYDSYRNSGFDFVKGYYDHVLTNDGLHPNQKGADILARKISAFINIQ